MKKYFYTCIILLTWNISFCQSIKFDYDLAGNRIKRYSESSAVDLTVSLVRPMASNFVYGQTMEGVLRIYNLRPGQTTGVVTVFLELGVGFELTIDPLAAVSAGLTVANSQWEIVDFGGGSFQMNSKPGIVIPANFFVNLGYKVKAVGNISSIGIITADILNQTGGAVPELGDDNNQNNSASKGFSIVF